MIAQLSLDTIPSFVVFIVGGSATIFLINQVLTFYKAHIKEQPTPANTYATKVELTKVETELKDDIDSLTTALTNEANSQAGKRKKIYENIEQLGRDMAGLKADNVTQTRQLFNVEQKVDRILERMPRIQS